MGDICLYTQRVHYYVGPGVFSNHRYSQCKIYLERLYFAICTRNTLFRLRSHWLTTSRHPFRVIKSHRPARLYQSRRSEAKTDGSGRGNSFRVYAKCNCANLRYRNRHIPICLFACLNPLPSGVLRPCYHNYQKLNPE